MIKHHHLFLNALHFNMVEVKAVSNLGGFSLELHSSFHM